MVTGIAESGVVAKSDMTYEAEVEATGVALSPLAKDVECSASIVVLVGSSPVEVDKGCVPMIVVEAAALVAVSMSVVSSLIELMMRLSTTEDILVWVSCGLGWS
jgi:hypothetical protein